MTQIAESVMDGAAVVDTAVSVGEPSPLAATRSESSKRPIRIAAIITSHTLVDIYSAFVAPLLLVLQVRCHLTDNQAAWLIGSGSLISGLTQPVSAWLSDKLDTRLFGAAGLAVTALCMCCIGLADSFWTLMPIYALGMIGSGVYHPTGASSMGQLAGRRRSLGISVFHLAGMIGGIIGSIAVTRITVHPDGFRWLMYLMVPGLVGAAFLHAAIRNAPHRHHAHHALSFNDADIRGRWRMIWVLFAANAMRFTVNTAMVYLFVRWVHELVADANPGLDAHGIARIGAPLNGNLNACMIIGMAIGGLSAGTLVRPGREKWPMILTAIISAPAIALFGGASIATGYFLAALAGFGFAAMVPVTISCAQRLLPHRTSLASGLMLGGSWALAFVGPRAAEYCLGSLGLSVGTTFTLTAGLLALSGLVCLGLSAKLLRQAA